MNEIYQKISGKVQYTKIISTLMYTDDKLALNSNRLVICCRNDPYNTTVGHFIIFVALTVQYFVHEKWENPMK